MEKEVTAEERIEIPIYQKLNLSMEEAAEYSHIGIKKLYELTNKPHCPFVLFVGERKRVIKRRAFEKFLEEKVVL